MFISVDENVVVRADKVRIYSYLQRIYYVIVDFLIKCRQIIVLDYNFVV